MTRFSQWDGSKDGGVTNRSRRPGCDGAGACAALGTNRNAMERSGQSPDELCRSCRTFRSTLRTKVSRSRFTTAPMRRPKQQWPGPRKRVGGGSWSTHLAACTGLYGGHQNLNSNLLVHLQELLHAAAGLAGYSGTLGWSGWANEQAAPEASCLLASLSVRTLAAALEHPGEALTCLCSSSLCRPG
jgi:hypothetical protein